jgi:hypothetical protein
MGATSRLQPDRRNANRGTARGRALLEDSLRRYGAGRSILADKHGNVIAGNKTLETAADLGLPVRVVETDGTELVVVQRRDLDLDADPRARELAYADNRVAELDLDWDVTQLLEDRDNGIDLAALGFTDHDLQSFSIQFTGVDIIGADITDAEKRTTNNMQMIGKGENVGLQFGDLMVTLPRPLYDQVWASVNLDRYPDRRAGIADILIAGLAHVGGGQC